MQRNLDSEKRDVNRIWNKKEKQIATVLDNLTEMQGEIEGIIGVQKILPAIETLSREGIIAEEEDFQTSKAGPLEFHYSLTASAVLSVSAKSTDFEGKFQKQL